VAHSIEHPDYSAKVLKLQAAILFDTNDLAGCKMLIDQLNQNDRDTLVNQACFLFKEAKYEEACAKYMDAMKQSGFAPDLSYYISLCYYMMKQYVMALKYLADIIERGIRDHPELNVGMATEGLDLNTVANSQILHETYLVEAFNLKAAIEYNLKNYEAAKEAYSILFSLLG
jgi:tetratricopeptide repeat protein 30